MKTSQGIETANDPLVRCDACKWIGRTSLLVNADGCHCCPECGEFFMPVDCFPETR